jgi:perosamine synthetase
MMAIPFHKAHLGEAEIDAVTDSIRSGWLTMGPKTIEFEKQFGAYIGANFSVSMNSATAALHLALKAIGVTAGDEVILPTHTFIATAEVVTYFNAIPVLCDVDPDHFLMDVRQMESLITPRTKAIIPVHFAGAACDMDAIMAIAKKHGLRVICDAAHSLPTVYRGRKIGTISDITCFSFYATKTLSTGEGGMATTADPDLAKSMKINRLHGISRDAWDRYSVPGSWYYEVVDNGHKYNMTDLNAALGLVQLAKCDWMRNERFQIAQKYSAAFEGTVVRPLLEPEYGESAWHLYVIRVANRDEVIKAMTLAGIGSSVHFIPVHRHPYYQRTYGFSEAQFPVSDNGYLESLSLPLYPGLSDTDIDRIVTCVLSVAR